MLKDACAPILLTQEHLVARLPTSTARVISIDDSASPIWSEQSDNLPHINTSDNLAYVIYTSGSTGTPKGVQISHRNVVRLFDSTSSGFGFSEHDTWSVFHSCAFDFSVWEIFGALLYGGRALMVPFTTARSPADFYRLISDERVTVLNQTPSAFRQLSLVEETASYPLPLALRLIILGGEALDMASLGPWFNRHGDVSPQIVNMYGTTETTVHVTVGRVRKNDLTRGSLIGTPIPDLQLHILDEDLRPAPVGVAGEIFVGGAGLARGYLNRPELTAERFIPDPFCSEDGARLYRTGDRASRLADGSYEFLGRLDRQVKVRGYRVELGEIEAVLDQHSAVHSSRVVPGRDGTGQIQLSAYVVANESCWIEDGDLRAFLATRLPDYMIPVSFTQLERWPLTAHGKLDQDALSRADDRNDVRPERDLSVIEARLLAFCRDILGRTTLGVDEPFLDAGFHSLGFAQLICRIQNELGASLNFSEVFARRSVADLAALVEERGAFGRAVHEPLTRADRSGDLPLSFSQERIWFLDKLHPGNIAYHSQSILRFHGRLDVSALERSLNLLVERHEILRTSFPERLGRPFQQINPYEPFTLAVEEALPLHAEQRITDVIRRPFDLEGAPPVRWILFRLAPEEHWLLHMQHHMLHDGWEYEIFLRELFECYDALESGRTPTLLPLRVQFADFAVWQRRQLASGSWDDELDYWQERLKEPPPPPELPTDRPRQSVQTFAGAQIRYSFAHEFHARLVAAAAREGVTPYMWLHAVFQTFLFRYTEQTDIIVGTGVANRQAAETQHLLGMIINTVALRINFSGNPTFREILARMREVILEALDNQDAPFDRVVQRLGPGTVLFNTFFDTYDRAYPSYRNDILRVERKDVVNNGSSKYDIVALVIPDGAAVSLLWEYNTDLFDEETASRMMNHFLGLLEASIASPRTPVGLLPMLSADETKIIAATGRGKSTIYPRDRRLDEIFAGVANSRPHAAAVICGAKRLTYRELNQRAAELADQLRAAGARAGEVVAFSLPRGPDALCAMLAILKSGCAYLPLDPTLPTARHEVLVRTAGAVMQITGDAIARFNSAEANPPQFAPISESAAFVLFTSGSTGPPKAVCVPHRAVARLVCDVDYIHLGAETRFLQLAPLSFDASTLEVWGPLLNGGAVVVHPEDVPDLTELGRTIADHKVTTAWLTAALFNQVVDRAPQILHSLSELLTGGEALSVPHVVRALAALPDTRLVNGYGPTETTTFATTYPIPRDFKSTNRRVPIGRSLPDTQVYVLDQRQQLLPVGVPGEICIGGSGLALGYLGDSGLTAKKFIPDFISGNPGERLYRSGDRGRLLPDGNLEFIERTDDQVKIRGIRIEPGEIESMLKLHRAAREAVVVVREDVPGDRRLVAYVAPAERRRLCGRIGRFFEREASHPDASIGLCLHRCISSYSEWQTRPQGAASA